MEDSRELLQPVEKGGGRYTLWESPEMKQLTAPDRIIKGVQCPKCHKWARIQYHEYTGRYQHTAYSCVCGEKFLRQLEAK